MFKAMFVMSILLLMMSFGLLLLKMFPISLFLQIDQGTLISTLLISMVKIFVILLTVEKMPRVLPGPLMDTFSPIMLN